jgi:hypothetical protein
MSADMDKNDNATKSAGDLWSTDDKWSLRIWYFGNDRIYITNRLDFDN